jgi:L-malate glycosyltransferase
MAMIRVLHLIKSIDIGGIETMALDFCNNAHKQEIEVHLICIGGGELENAFAASPAIFVKLKKFPFPYDIVDPILILRLRRYIRKNNIDIVHCHFADEGLHALAATYNYKVKVVQGWAVDFRINRDIDNRKFRFIGKYAHASVALTDVLLQQAIEFRADPFLRGVTIHNGIDPERVVHKGKGTLKQDLNIPENAVLGGMTGNFYNHVRDQFTVCKALAEIMPHFPDFHFVFAGGSTNRWIKKNRSYFDKCVDFCRKNKLDRVHFPGLQKNVSNVLGSLDFYVHATNYDTFGIAPVEAMFNQLPVIANDHPVFMETSHHGKGMLLYRDKNHLHLSRQIGALLEDPEKRVQLGQTHWQHANTHFHIDVHVKNMKAFYKKLLRHG